MIDDHDRTSREPAGRPVSRCPSRLAGRRRDHERAVSGKRRERHGQAVLHAAPAGELASRLNVALGHVEFFEDGLVVACVLPGQWLVLGSADSADLVERLVSIATDEASTVVDVTDGRFLVRLTGVPAPLTLARLCSVDLGDRSFPTGSATTTLWPEYERRSCVTTWSSPTSPGLQSPAELRSAPISLRGPIQARVLVASLLDAGESLGLEFEGGAAYRSGRTEL